MKKVPFIKLIDYFGECYVYDVNRDNILKISKGLYSYLEAVLSGEDGGCKDEAVLEEYETLREEGYLSSRRMEVLQHPATETLPYLLERRMHTMTLQVTQSCNLRCSYCIYSENNNEKQRSHSGKKMSLETALKAVDFLAEHSIDSERINIGFYGGEPVLAMDLIRSVVDYAEDIFSGKELHFSITTNATLLTEEIAEYFDKHNFLLTISLDGPKEIHDQSRRFADGRGTFDTVVKNLEMIWEKYGGAKGRIGINMVMNLENSFRAINQLFQESDVFTRGVVRATVVDDFYSEEKNHFSEDFFTESEYQFFLSYISRRDKSLKGKMSPIAQQELDRLEDMMDKMGKRESLTQKGAPGGPCIPGRQRMFIDADGNFYPCERVSEKSAVMRIGNLKDGFDLDQIRQMINISQLTAEACKNCWAAMKCTQCIKYADAGETLSAEARLAHCEKVRAGILSDLKKIILLHEIDRSERGD